MSEKILSVGIYTLGCKVNQYESEAISEALEEKGFSVFKDGEGYDISIINTCTVTAELVDLDKKLCKVAVAKIAPV